MNPAERVVVWFLGFLAGVSLGIIAGGGGGGGWDWPFGGPSPKIPDYVPEDLIERT